ncbi:MAG: hypothetical protein KR126chlam1_01052 [Chlamydiae bacterium]|nr:hypothetical protein [Chlamydiota bacterium]
MHAIFSTILFLASLTVIEESIPDGPFCYPGKCPREIITVDSEESPLLDAHFKKLVQLMQQDQSEQEKLAHVKLFVRETIFTPSLCNFEKLLSFFQTLDIETFEPEIPLEKFIAAKTGVCRHLALTTTFLLDRLIKEGHFKGSCYLIRDQVHLDRHAWTLFLSDKEAWHIDAHWNILEDGKSEEGFSRLSRIYGKRTMVRQKERWSNTIYQN